MGNMLKTFLVVCVFFIKGYSAFAQSITYSASSYIVSFNAVYRSNLLALNTNGYDDIYLITFDKPVRIDSFMFSLSTKDYTSLHTILDTIGFHAKIYTIVKDTSSKESKNDFVSRNILDYNNYHDGYFIPMIESVRKSSAVVAYIVQVYSSQKKIGYTILKSDCDEFPYECKAVIKRIE